MSKKLTLVTPGPVKIPAIVGEYLLNPPCNYHRQDGFKKMFDDNQRDIKALLGLRAPSAFFVTTLLASGTGSNEACMRALSTLGKGVIVRNGFFGQRLVDQCVRGNLDHVVFDAPHDRPLDVAALDAFLKATPGLKWAYFVSHETRATLRNPLVEIGRTLKAHDLFVGADCVSSAFAYELEIERARLDLVVATTSKGLMAVPGLGLVLCRHGAMAALKAAGKASSYYFDLVGEYEKQMKESAPRFGQPVELHAAVRAACIHLLEVGIANHHARMQTQMAEMIAHLDGLGVVALLEPSYRANVVVNFRLPPHLRYPELQALMAQEGFYILYGVIEDPSMFQLCTMGDLTDLDLAGLKAAFSKVLLTSARAVA
ncbi:MAG: alanine--glyoxylate aminotransferase family protein [Deltaproteobacteria bacterium]|nr:alanine--glyoxylate aminotransferase family protein [Deltaproteobacteria bacterium]